MYHCGVQSVRFNKGSNKHITHARTHERTGPSLQIIPEKSRWFCTVLLIHLKSGAAIPPPAAMRTGDGGGVVTVSASSDTH